jgi:hypothetical protein
MPLSGVAKALMAFFVTVFIQQNHRINVLF